MDKEQCKTLMHERAICVIIPTYNNGGSIARVVADVQEYCSDVYVVDDGSTDTTSATLASIDGITVITNSHNRGKGHALKRAFRRARKEGFAYAVTIDADGQHYASDLPGFVEANMEHPGSLIVGSRQMDGAERSKGSTFANKFSNFWFAVQTGRVLPDTQTGYRLYPLKKLWGLWLTTNRYESELELLVGSSWHGVPIHSIPVSVYYPPREERVSHFRPVVDFSRITVLNTVLCLLAVVYALPLAVLRFLLRTVRTVYSLLVLVLFCFLIATPLVWIYVKTRRMNEQRQLRLHRWIQLTASFFMERHGIPGARFTKQVSGAVDFDKPHIVICNHQSHLDLMCQLLFTPRMVFLTNNWVWRNPFYGFIIRQAEFYPVADGIEALLPRLRSLAERGYSIAIYPEGTRSADCRIGRFHQGAFWVARQLQLPILPMYLYGAGKVLPKKSHRLHSGRIHIEVDEAMSCEQMDAMGSEREQAREMRKIYRERYQKIANRIEQDV